MLLLAFDTIGPALSATAMRDDEVVAERSAAVGRERGEHILPMLANLLRHGGWRWGDLELVAASTGPGGFGAVRLGVTVARALAVAVPCPVIGIGTLEALAEAAGPGEPLTALMDAGPDALFRQDFDAGLGPLGVASRISVEAAGSAAWARRRVVGAAALLDRLGVAGAARVEAVPTARHVARRARRLLASGVRPAAGPTLRPLYLRAPDARPEAGRPLVAATG